jgi:hypothetical protein
MNVMIAKITKPMRPTRRIPSPAMLETFENSSHVGVLASFKTRMYDVRSVGVFIPFCSVSGVF